MSLSSWSARHTQAFLASLGRLLRSPLATIFTVLVIALALALPMSLKLFVANARTATGDFANAVDLTVYFKSDVPLSKAQQLAKSARARTGVANVTLISSDDALKEFRKYSGFGDALQALESNPLPHVLNVQPRGDHSDPAALQKLRDHFAAWPEVDLVQVDSEWVLRFNAILDFLRRSLALAAIVLGIGVIAVIGNTIRLEILNRRAEIEVTKLVGGSNAFVRRPFLYTGLLYGVLGALLAWALLGVGTLLLADPVDLLAKLYGSRFMLQGPTFDDALALLGGGALLGLLGAWLAAARHLRAIEPRA